MWTKEERGSQALKTNRVAARRSWDILHGVLQTVQELICRTTLEKSNTTKEKREGKEKI